MAGVALGDIHLRFIRVASVALGESNLRQGHRLIVHTRPDFARLSVPWTSGTLSPGVLATFHLSYTTDTFLAVVTQHVALPHTYSL